MKKVLAKAHKNKPRVQKQPATEGNKEGSITSKIMSSLKNVVGGSGSKSDPKNDTVKTMMKRTGTSRRFSKKKSKTGEEANLLNDDDDESD